MSDEVEIANVPAGAPVPTPLHWTLAGPLPWGPERSCSGLDWSSAPIATSGDVTIVGNGTVRTPAQAVSTPGCYSFGESLPATSASHAVALAPGQPSETALIDELLITTATSTSTLRPGGSAHDVLDVSGTSAGTGTSAWTLLGPVKPIDDGCTSVSWSGAPELAAGSIAITGDGSYATDDVPIPLPGCYSWQHTVTGTFPSPTVTTPGAPNEVLEVAAHEPTISTHVTLSTSGARTFAVDHISLRGTGIGGSGDVTSNQVRWSLLGPATPVDGSCAKVDWLAVSARRVGSITVTGDGDVATRQVEVSEAGCYTFTEQMAETTTALAVSTAPGIDLESFSISPPNGGGGGSGGGQLAFTGADLFGLGATAAVLLLLGTSLLVVRRRRRA